MVKCRNFVKNYDALFKRFLALPDVDFTDERTFVIQIARYDSISESVLKAVDPRLALQTAFELLKNGVCSDSVAQSIGFL